jgi:hypothetical protein
MGLDMLIAATEGQGWRYEVIVQSDGFLVQARDLTSGEVAPGEVTLFRTATVAFAYADLAAAADRCAAARCEDEFDEELEDAFARERVRFASVRFDLADEGVEGAILLRRGEARRPVLH